MGSNTYGLETRAVLDAFRRIVQGLRESSRAAERRVGVSGAQLFVLQTLAEAPKLSLNELAERTRTHQSSVSAVVARLARARLVERRTAPADARRAELSLTARGQTRLESAPRTAQQLLVAAVDALPTRERMQLAVALAHLVDGMGLANRRPAMLLEEPAARKPAARKRKTGRTHA